MTGPGKLKSFVYSADADITMLGADRLRNLVYNEAKNRYEIEWISIDVFNIETDNDADGQLDHR